MSIPYRSPQPGDAGSSRCAVCDAPLPATVQVRLPRAHLKACPACRSWSYFPRPAQEQQSALHNSGAYFDHPYFELRRSIGPAHRRRCRRVFSRLAAAVDVSGLRGHRLLDVGCDTGTFLAAAAEEFGVVPVGVDVAEMAVATARGRGIEAWHATIEEAPESLTGLPVITAIDLIEHVSEPARFLREIFRRLAPGGVVYLETPNIESAVYGAGRMLSPVIRGRESAWMERLFPAQHVQYFTAASLAALGRTCGFEVAWMDTRVLPWRDMGTSAAVRAAMAVLQTADRLTRNRILICAVMRRPSRAGAH
jgi:2-polyprenyl-3-methyl-5-hydroxy-6-metoxy-1,4-benzoquinol methylase